MVLNYTNTKFLIANTQKNSEFNVLQFNITVKMLIFLI